MQQLEDNVLRLAIKEDLTTLVDFASKFHSTTPYSNLSFDRDKVTLFINSLIDNKEQATIIVLLEEGKPVGCLIGYLEENIFGLELTSLELMFWVEEQYRGKNSWQLIEAYQYWSKLKGCSSCCVSSLQGPLVDKLDSKYKDMGFNPIEHTYMKVL